MDSNEQAEQSIKSTFKVGTLVNARDLQDNWYKSRIIEIDEQNQRAKVHFFGWNSRYDQWFDINSNDLRELPFKATPQSTAPQAPSTNIVLPPEALEYDKITDRFDMNTKVWAKWTDNFFYPARILKHLRRNRTLYYDVKFDDGMKRIVRYDFVKLNADMVAKEAIAPNKAEVLTKEVGDKKDEVVLNVYFGMYMLDLLNLVDY
jgi:hypothetical protein